MKWRVILPLVMLSLAALACDGDGATVTGVTGIEADPERAGVVYVEVSTFGGYGMPDLDIQPQQSFEVSHYGYTWRQLERSIASVIPDEYTVMMDDAQTLLIDGTAVWRYPYPNLLDEPPITDPRLALDDHVPTPRDWYTNSAIGYSEPGPRPFTALDYAISPADPETMFVALFDLGILVGPIPDSTANRPWELHILKTIWPDGIDLTRTGNVMNLDAVLANVRIGNIRYWLLVIGLSLLPASLMHSRILAAHWRRNGFTHLQGEFKWLLGFVTLLQAVMCAALWGNFRLSSMLGGVVIATIPLAAFTAFVTIALGRANPQPRRALSKPTVQALLYTLITPVLWVVTLFGLLLWPVLGLVVLVGWLRGKIRQRRQARRAHAALDTEVESTPSD